MFNWLIKCCSSKTKQHTNEISDVVPNVTGPTTNTVPNILPASDARPIVTEPIVTGPTASTVQILLPANEQNITEKIQDNNKEEHTDEDIRKQNDLHDVQLLTSTQLTNEILNQRHNYEEELIKEKKNEEISVKPIKKNKDITIVTVKREENKYDQCNYDRLDKYCELHGYKLVTFSSDNNRLNTKEDETFHETWKKILILLNNIKLDNDGDNNKNEDSWIIWMSNNVVVTNPLISLESYIQYAEQQMISTNIIVSQDPGHKTGIPFNHEIIMVRNCNWSYQFLLQVWIAKSEWLHAIYYDQTVVTNYYASNFLDCQKHLFVVPLPYLQTYFSANTDTTTTIFANWSRFAFTMVFKTNVSEKEKEEVICFFDKLGAIPLKRPKILKMEKLEKVE